MMGLGSQSEVKFLPASNTLNLFSALEASVLDPPLNFSFLMIIDEELDEEEEEEFVLC